MLEADMTGGDENGDAIHLQELELLMRIGVPDEERAEPQRLTISITIWPTAGFRDLQDQIDKAVDYSVVAREAKEFAAARRGKLIETLADEIAAHLLQTFPLDRVRLELRKFILPEVKYVAVILTRERFDRNRAR